MLANAFLSGLIMVSCILVELEMSVNQSGSFRIRKNVLRICCFVQKCRCAFTFIRVGARCKLLATTVDFCRFSLSPGPKMVFFSTLPLGERAHNPTFRSPDKSRAEQ
jgi:hypothetical protein